MLITTCPKCGSDALVKRGKGINMKRTFYRSYFQCKGCGKKFSGERIPVELEEQEYIPKSVPPQNWSAYAKAQNNEKLMLMDLLAELSEIIQTEEIRKVGRPRTDLHEMIFCLALKTYTKLSSRRLNSDLEMTQKLGLISHVPHFTTIMKYFNEEQMTGILKQLIELSALPIKQVEADFAVDSSGFSTSQFGRWFDHKFGKEVEKRLYLKSHIMVGVKSNIVTSVEISGQNGNDSPYFEPLVNSTSQRFSIKEVSADKAYSSRKNLDLVDRLGGTAYIPFRAKVTGKARGLMLWRKMFLYFKEHRQEFLEHYHKRSNVESAFFMIKQKFGGTLLTKTFTAQKNEILCKLIAHNIIVLIQEIHELGIKADF